MVVALHADIVDGRAHGGCQVLAHLLAMRRHLRRLSCDNAVDVDDLVALFAHISRNGPPTASWNRTPSHSGIGVGEKLADIAAADGAEQRIGHGMRQHSASEWPSSPRVCGISARR